MALGSVDKEVVTRWLLDDAQYKREIKELSKEVRAQQRHERNLSMVRKQLERQTDRNVTVMQRLSRATSRWNTTSTAATAAGNLWASAIVGIKGSLSDLIKEHSEYAQASAIFRGDVREMADATGNLADHLTVMQARNRMNTLGVKLSNDEYTRVLKSLTKVSTAMGQDLNKSVDDLTTALARQSVQIADNIGITLTAEQAYERYALANNKLAKDLTAAEKKLAFQAEVLRQLDEKARDLPPRLNTLGDQWTRMTNQMRNSSHSMMREINESWGHFIDQLGTAGSRMQTTAIKVTKAIAMITGDPGVQKSLQVLQGLSTIGAADASERARIAAQGGVFRGGATVRGGGAAETGPTGLFATRDETERLGTKEGHGRFVKSRSGRRRRDAPTEEGRAAFREAQETLRRLEAQARGLGRLTKTVEGSQGLIEGQDAEQKRLEKRNADERVKDRLHQRRMRRHEQHMDALRKSNEMQEKTRAIARGISEDYEATAMGGLASFTGAIVDAGIASIASGESFAAAAQKALAGVLAALSKEAAIKAVFNIAEGFANWMNPAGAAMHFTAAAKYGAVAVAAGAGAALAAGGSGGAAGGASGGAAGRQRGREFDGPQFGRRERQDRRPINVNVYLGDAKDPSAALIAQSQLRTQLEAA